MTDTPTAMVIAMVDTDMVVMEDMAMVHIVVEDMAMVDMEDMVAMVIKF